MKQSIIAIIILSLLAVSASGQHRSYDYNNMTPEEIEQLRQDRHAFYTAKSAAKDEAIKRELLNEATKVDGNQNDYDVRYYGLDISLDFSTETIDAHVDYKIKSRINGLNSVDLNLRDELSVTSVTVDDAPASFSHNMHLLSITTPTSYNLDEEFEMSVYYNGTPYFAYQQGMDFENLWGYMMCWTNCEPFASRNWWPCKDYPLDKPDSMDIYIEYPSAYKAVSNGAIISDVDIGGGRNRIHYKHNYPIATYLVAIACADFNEDIQTWNYDSVSMPVYSYALPYAGDSYNAYRTYMPGILTVLSDKWQLYPFYTEKAGNANYGWGGAMEHQTCSFYSPWFYDEWVIAHETGHQWWGDMITCHTFHDIWLNEGFASYTEPLYFEAISGQAAYFNYIRSQRYLGGGTVYVEDLLNDDIFDNNLVYDKASWVLHMLRGIVGDDAFFQAIADYYDSEYKFASATTANLADVVSASLGYDMSWYFDQWIYGDGCPDYEISMLCEPDTGNGYLLNMIIAQVQIGGTYFKMPLRTTFVTTGGNIDTTIWNENTVVDVHMIWFPDSVTEIIVDPQEWVLRKLSYVPLGFYIATRILPDGEKEVPYYQKLKAVGGVPPYYWTKTGGDLPIGLAFDGDTVGVISGTPIWPSQYYFTIEVTDSDTPPNTDEWTFNMLVTEPGEPPLIGDADGNGVIEVTDAVFLVDYIFNFGPAPDPEELGDADCSGIVEITDVVFLIDYIFNSGPVPECP